ncbi:unannotated protein [freshwater metagenome]|uniref:Unannotated protein n=1 Tax=freshwater metagenome TaxID=449393 RepID=A0A6J5YMR4_9ZZZZ|nr:hypothetical protein [Actinomycetota bacterium]MSX42952.1 hypothetical protein [Actinomycetota bacterium]MTB09936.1 hypothetical protein [Actinomycetota bacterium]
MVFKLENSPTLAPGSINFCWGFGKTYPNVQQQIFDLIEAQLPPGVVTHTVEDAVSGAVNLSLFIRQGREQDDSHKVAAEVILAHGIADKRYFFTQDSTTSMPLANEYEYLLVPGSWHVNRLIEGTYRRNPHYQITVEQKQIKKVGWLRLDPLIHESKHRDREPHHRLRILWAPTHNVIPRSNEKIIDTVAPSSLPGFKTHVKQLAERYIFRVSLHPRNRSDRTPTGNQLVWSDVVISDFGTMVYEAWALGKPVIFPRWAIDVETLITRNPLSAESYIYRNRIGLHPESLAEMQEMLDEIQSHLVGNYLIRLLKRLTRIKTPRKSAADYRGKGVAEFVDHYIDPTNRGQDAKRTANVLIEIAQTRENLV